MAGRGSTRLRMQQKIRAPPVAAAGAMMMNCYKSVNLLWSTVLLLLHLLHVRPHLVSSALPCSRHIEVLLPRETLTGPWAQMQILCRLSLSRAGIAGNREDLCLCLCVSRRKNCCQQHRYLSVCLSHTWIAGNNIDLCNVCVSLSRRNSCCQHRSLSLCVLSLRRRNWRWLEQEPRMSRLPAHLMQNLLLALSSTNPGVHCKNEKLCEDHKKKKKKKRKANKVELVREEKRALH